MRWRHRTVEALRRDRTLPTLPTLRGPGALALVGLWVGLGTPAMTPGAGGRVVQGPAGPVVLLHATTRERGAGSRPQGVRVTFAEAVEAARLAWSRQDAAGIVARSRNLLLQLPGADTRASVSRDQAVRLVEGVLRRSEPVSVRVQTSREVGPGQGYAELIRMYRVTGTEEVLSQRVLLAFRLATDGSAWELVELRVLQAGERLAWL